MAGIWDLADSALGVIIGGAAVFATLRIPISRLEKKVDGISTEQGNAALQTTAISTSLGDAQRDIVELRTDMAATRADAAEAKRQALPNGGSSMRDGITAIKVEQARQGQAIQSQGIEIRDIKQGARDLAMRVEASLQVIRRHMDPGETR